MVAHTAHTVGIWDEGAAVTPLVLSWVVTALERLRNAHRYHDAMETLLFYTNSLLIPVFSASPSQVVSNNLQSNGVCSGCCPSSGTSGYPSAASTAPSGLCCPFSHLLPPYYNLQLSNLVLKPSCRVGFEPCSAEGEGPCCFAAAHHHALGTPVPVKLQPLPLDKAG